MLGFFSPNPLRKWSRLAAQGEAEDSGEPHACGWLPATYSGMAHLWQSGNGGRLGKKFFSFGALLNTAGRRARPSGPLGSG